MSKIKVNNNSIGFYNHVTGAYIGKQRDGKAVLGDIDVPIAMKQIMIENYEKSTILNENVTSQEVYNWSEGLTINDVEEILQVMKENFEMVEIQIEENGMLKQKLVQVRKN